MKFKKGEEVLFSGSLNGQNLFTYHTAHVPDNYYDCFGIHLSFLSNKEDPLNQKRKEFFAKFFLYDSNYIDVM
jgi:hypothetical protein